MGAYSSSVARFWYVLFIKYLYGFWQMFEMIIIIYARSAAAGEVKHQITLSFFMENEDPSCCQKKKYRIIYYT